MGMSHSSGFRCVKVNTYSSRYETKLLSTRDANLVSYVATMSFFFIIRLEGLWLQEVRGF